MPGVTTEELDGLVRRIKLQPRRDPGDPGLSRLYEELCTSINHVVCHGIPGDKTLKDGDIVNIDVTAILDGWYGDTSRMYWSATSASRRRSSSR